MKTENAYISCDLLSQHIIVTLPAANGELSRRNKGVQSDSRRCRQVVSIPVTDTTESRVAVSPTSPPTDFQSFSGSCTAQCFQTAGSRMQVGLEICTRIKLLWTGASV